MTDKEKIEILQDAFQETIWMAIRYANGRHTYAPDMVRVAIKNYRLVFPDWSPQDDITIKPPTNQDLGGVRLESDYLHDIFDSGRKS